jgi:hypothetical protein
MEEAAVHTTNKLEWEDKEAILDNDDSLQDLDCNCIVIIIIIIIRKIAIKNCFPNLPLIVHNVIK